MTFSPSLKHFVDLHGNDSHQEITLVLVVVVDRADGNVGGRRNGFHLYGIISRTPEKLRRRIEDTFEAKCFLPDPKTAHSSDRAHFCI